MSRPRDGSDAKNDSLPVPATNGKTRAVPFKINKAAPPPSPPAETPRRGTRGGPDDDLPLPPTPGKKAVSNSPAPVKKLNLATTKKNRPPSPPPSTSPPAQSGGKLKLFGKASSPAPASPSNSKSPPRSSYDDEQDDLPPPPTKGSAAGSKRTASPPPSKNPPGPPSSSNGKKPLNLIKKAEPKESPPEKATPTKAKEESPSTSSFEEGFSDFRKRSAGSVRKAGSRHNMAKKSILDFKKSFQLGTKDKLYELQAQEKQERALQREESESKVNEAYTQILAEIDLTAERRMRSLSIHPQMDALTNRNTSFQNANNSDPAITPSSARTRAGAVSKDAGTGGADTPNKLMSKAGSPATSFQEHRVLSAIRSGTYSDDNDLEKARLTAAVNKAQKEKMEVMDSESRELYTKDQLIEGIVKRKIDVSHEALCLTWSYCMEGYLLMSKLFNIFFQKLKDPKASQAAKENAKSFLLTWLEEASGDFDDDRISFLLFQWHTCLKSSGEMSDNLFGEELVSVWEVIHKPQRIQAMSLPELRELNWKKISSSVAKIKPDEIIEKTPLLFLASQLLLIDFGMFTQVKHHDLLQTNWEVNSNSTLVAVRDDFNWGVHWVASEILGHSSAKTRVNILSTFLKIAQIFLRMHNMNGAMKIYRALTLPCVSRLKKAWTALPKEDIDVYNKLADILNYQGNFSAYHEHLKSAKGSRIPAFIILMEELEAIRNRDVSNSDEVIDLQTLTQFADLVAYFEKYQHISFGIPRDSVLIGNIKARPCNTEKRLNYLSQEVEPIPDTEELEYFYWYFGAITRSEAEQILLLCDSDCFLIRKQSDSLIISCKNAGELQVIHKLIDKGNAGYFVQGSSVSYQTIGELVKNSPELFGYGAASTPTARQIKRKYGLRTEFSIESFDQFTGCSSLQSKTNKFFSNDIYENDDQEPNFFTMSKVDNALEEMDLPWILNMMKNGEVPFSLMLRNQQSILHLIATHSNNPRYVELVMEGNHRKPNIDARDANGWTALHNACHFGHLKVIGALLQYGAEVNAVNGNGGTPLHTLVRVKAVSEQEYTAMLQLLWSLGANLNCRDGNHDTPLSKACMFVNDVAIKFLVARGADVNVRNKQGESPMSLGLRCRSKTTREVLMTAYQKCKNKKYLPPDEEFYLLQNAKFTSEDIDDGTSIDEEIERWEKSPTLQNRPYRDLFADNEDHFTFMAKNPKRGVFCFTIAKVGVFYRCLIRTKESDALVQLVTFPDGIAVLESCEMMSPLDWKFYAKERYSEVLVDGERQLVAIHQHTVGLLYVGKDSCEPKQVFAYRSELPKIFNQFLYFLKGSKSELSFGEDRSTLSLVFKREPINFHIFNLLPEGNSDRENALNYPVLIVFTEGSSFDASLVSKYSCNVILVVKPIQRPKSDPPTYYSLDVLMRHSTVDFDPRLPPEAPYPQEDEFRKFFLAKVLSADKYATLGDALEKIASSRAARLDIVFNECETVTHINRKSMAEMAFSSEGKDLYLLGEELGSGATSTAYRATHKHTRKQYCVKVVNKAELRTPQIQQQVSAEVDLLSRIDHPNIVRCYETFETLAHLYIVLELCSGGTLTAEVKSNGTFPEATCAKVIYQMLDALRYLHNVMKISHRDLKPDNVLFADDTKKSIRIVDFGFSKDTQGQVMKNTIGGTLDYIAPEVIGGAKYDYFQIDIWSVGCIAYYLLFGNPPFHEAKTMVEIISAITTGAYTFESKRVKLTDEAKAFVKKLLTVDPNKRPTAAVALTDPWLLLYNSK
eukprot:TRINITY_DN3074_c0_g1_i1.p1 TRINITY_DN3074_c0_g1~~TRINITY_DN3074_c0_g1_i1.p1  ORF type:complete len:1759 (-),score=507.44 TRINITY_DN3074_c0_g1_i1:20-5296(-)